MTLSRESVERAIAETTRELPRFVLDKKYFEQFTDAPYDRDVLGHFAGVGGRYLTFLSLLIQKLNPTRLLELGSYAGASTVAMYAGMHRDALLTTVDVAEDQRYCTTAMRGDSRVRFVLGDVCDLAIYGENIPMDVDFLYEDTFHFYDHLKDIFDIYEHLLADRALVAVDDIRTNDKGRFFDEVSYRKWDLTELCHKGGWGLFLFERKEQRSPAERFLAAHRAATSVWKRRFDKKAEVVDMIEMRRNKNSVRGFLHRHKSLHGAVLALKKTFGIIPKDALSSDDYRSESGAYDVERAYWRKNLSEEQRRGAGEKI